MKAAEKGLVQLQGHPHAMMIGGVRSGDTSFPSIPAMRPMVVVLNCCDAEQSPRSQLPRIATRAHAAAENSMCSVLTNQIL